MTVLFVIGRLLPQGNHNIRWVVSAGLAQVSEFSFVLGSRGRRLGLLSREVSRPSAHKKTDTSFYHPAAFSITNTLLSPFSFHRSGLSLYCTAKLICNFFLSFLQVYLLILSITTLSLCLAPILWKVTLWQRHRISNRAAPLSPR